VGVLAELLRHVLAQHRINRAVNRRLSQLEFRMALTDEALADLDAATNEVAAELEELRDLLSGADQALAGRITAAATRLRGLAADPENPVPPPNSDV
jgi:hypothetical protein